MTNLGEFVTNGYNWLFSPSTWSSRRKKGVLAMLAYTAALYAYAAGSRVQDRELFEEIEHPPMAFADRNFFGEGPYVNKYTDKLIEKLGFTHKGIRIEAEGNPERLVEYRNRGYVKFIASFPILASVIPLTVLHPSGILIAPAGIYLNWDGESEYGPPQNKIKSLRETKTPTLETEIQRLETALYFKETEPDLRYWPLGLNLLTLSVFGTLAYGVSKLPNHGDRLITITKAGYIAVAFGAALAISSKTLPYMLYDPRIAQQAEIRYELGEAYRQSGKLESAITQFNRALELNNNLANRMTQEQKKLLSIN